MERNIQQSVVRIWS